MSHGWTRQARSAVRGDRKPQKIRSPRDLYTTAEQAATDAGYDKFQDYIVDVVAKAHGQPVRFHPNCQQRLPS
jgi:hypothetical protein